MQISLKPLAEQVVVITGASSGIGLATARKAARAGAKVVLNSRSGQALQKIADELNAEGGDVVFEEGDVSDRKAVERLATRAMEQFGRIDTWVNNAGTSVFGELRQVSDDDSRKLFDTNFWGTVYGSLTAVEHLEQHGGAIINVGSVASEMSIPLQGMYSATKHAVKGFTDALRMELEDQGIPISVTLIKPTSTNTPFPQRARNYMDREPKLPDPVYAPEEVAYGILYAAENPCRDLNIGGAGKVMTALAKWAPGLMDSVSKRYILPMQQRNETPRHPEGSLHRPSQGGEVQGEHPYPVLSKCLYTRAITNRVAAGATLAAAGLVTAYLFRHSRDRC